MRVVSLRAVATPAAVALAGVTLAAATLATDTRDEYRDYVETVDARFQARESIDIAWWVDQDPARPVRLRNGEILAEAAADDGILNVTDGLIHHWVGAAFMDGTTLSEVTDVMRRYDEFSRIHEPIVRSELLEADGNIYKVYMRLRQGTTLVTAVLDTWWTTMDDRVSPERLYAMSRVERILQVQNADEDDERVLPEGTGSGYLWLANTYSTFLERDGGTYIELQTVGLSREIPLWIRWIAAPIAKRVGRNSVAQTLQEIRDELDRARAEEAAGASSGLP